MIVAIGYIAEKPPKRCNDLLSGPLLIQTTISPKKGFARFVIQDLKCYRDEKGGILPVIGLDEIEWTENGELLIGEVE